MASTPLLSGIDKARFEHCLILARSGHGKTSLIQAMLARDLARCVKGECSILVIDSQKQLIPTITNLAIWRKHIDRLMVIDPSRYIPAFNPLSSNRSHAAANETFRFIINSLLVDSSLTGMQALVFDQLMNLANQVPDVTLETLLNMTRNDCLATFGKYIKQLHPLSRTFFETEYLTDQYKDTRRQVGRRLWQVLTNNTLGAMFTQPESRVDIGQAMNSGTCILIDTDSGFLQVDGSRLFGSFFIAQLLGELLSRSTNAKPCYVYIDEFHEYTKHSTEAIGLLFKQARKRRVGLTVATQNLADFTVNHDNVVTNTAIKFAGGLNTDARAMSYLMNVEDQILRGGTKGSFIVTGPNVYTEIVVIEHRPEHNIRQNYVKYQAPKNLLETLPRLTEAEQEQLWKVMQHRYGAAPEAPPPKITDVDPRTNQDW